MLEFSSKVVQAPNFITGDNKVSRAAAFLFAFSVLHSLPNWLLLFPGPSTYQAYAEHLRGLRLLSVFEAYLGLSFGVHAFLGARAALAKPVGALGLSGVVLLGFLVKHLTDFRFGSLEKLGETVSETVRSQRAIYAAGVLAVGVHTWSGLRPAWLFSLGFRGGEITRLLLLGRLLTLLSTAGYLVPLTLT